MASASRARRRPILQARCSQQVLQAGRERDVACVDGVLGVAEEMGEADLMVGFSPAHLCAVAVGDPHGGTDVGEEVRDHVLAAAVANDEAAVFAVMEDPGPPVLFADPDAGLVRLQHGACKQAGADQVVLPGERRPAVGEHVDQRAFADRKPEQIRHQPRQPRERDGVHEAQIDHESPQVRPERRARRHVAGASARKASPQHGHSPRCSVTRVTSGLISGISTWSQAWNGVCATPDTSVPQCQH